MSTYETHRWYHVKITYQRTGTAVKLKYWIDGEYLGEYNDTIVDLSRELSLDHFEFVAQEGSTYIDNIVIYH